jgi:hypothetical protein
MPKATQATTTKSNITPADPFIAARATLKRLDLKWLDMASARDAATEAGASGPSESDVEAASDQALAAAWEMARTEPTTTAGAAAMLRYLTRDPMYGLWKAFDYGKAVWLETGFQTLERSLAKMARGSRSAA